MTVDLRDFDPADYRDSNGQAELLNNANAGGDRAYGAHAIGTIARAKRCFHFSRRSVSS